MTSSRIRRAAVPTMAALAVAVMTATVSACGGGSPVAEPTAASSSAQPAAPKSGKDQVAEVAGAQLTAPGGWIVEYHSPSWRMDPVDENGDSPGGAVFAAKDSGLATSPEELAEAALTAEPDGERLPDVKFGGYTFYHVRSQNKTLVFDSYGVYVDGETVNVRWTFIKKMVDRKQMDAWIEELMSTFKHEG